MANMDMMPNQKESDSGALVTVAIIALLVGFGIGGWVWPGRGVTTVKDGSEAEDVGSDEEMRDVLGKSGEFMPGTIGMDTAGPLALAADDQSAGVTASISSVRLDDLSWIVIHEDDAGKPGRILGAKRLDAGTHAGVVVELLRGTEAGKTYYAMIHADDGDKAFDHKKDLVRVNEGGIPVAVSFQAQ